MTKLAPLLLAATALCAAPLAAQDAPPNPATSTPEATSGIGPGAADADLDLTGLGGSIDHDPGELLLTLPASTPTDLAASVLSRTAATPLTVVDSKRGTSTVPPPPPQAASRPLRAMAKPAR